MALFEILDSVFAPLVAYPALFVLIISLFITLLVTVLNILLIKKETRQHIKGRMKHFQEEMKKAQKEKDMKKMSELQKGQLEVQMLHFKESMKISAATILLLWLIFAWMQHLYIPTTTIDANGTGTITFDTSSHNLTITTKDAQTRVLTSDGKSYELLLSGLLFKDYQNSEVDLYGREWKAELSTNNKLTMNLVMADLPVFGNVGLIGWYILTAFAFGILFRKLFDVM